MHQRVFLLVAPAQLISNADLLDRPLHPSTELHPLHLPTQPVRFRDNLEGLKFEGYDISTLHHSFKGMYNLDLQIEGESIMWDWD